jgi:beta-lactamase superfamily II metal-dependent hydrolase
VTGQIDLLNMGRTKYGDCIVVQSAGKLILIDGGHPGDDKDRDDRPSIPSQLQTVLSRNAPFHFDLLVVTHCHQDHIGCLPKLIANGTVTCDRALVADEKFGFGIDAEGNGDVRLARVGARIRNVLAALGEEDHSNLRGDELEEFLADAASLQDNYNSMLRTLEQHCHLIRYRQGTPVERNKVAQLVNQLSDTGLKIFGPTADQLVLCAQTIQRVSGDAADMLSDMGDPTESIGEAYLRIMTSDSDAADVIHHEIGWAKNCQSIVLSFGNEGERVLLPGDMQFAEPGIPEIDQFVRQLRRDVMGGGPYVFAKLPHHTSHNGTNEVLLNEWGWPPLLGHSGGFNDPTHPFPDTLNLLKRLRREHQFTYARTDRNGRITVEPADKSIHGEKGRLNNFTPNATPDEQIPQVQQIAEVIREEPAAVARLSNQFIDITFVRMPYLDGQVSIDRHVVEIKRSDDDYQRSRLSPSTIPRGPQEAKLRPPDPSRPALTGAVLGGGRTLPTLMFVTDPERLKQNIGEDADRALAIIQDAGHSVITDAGVSLIDATRRALASKQPKGVVLLGGYDVVPSQRVDVLGPDLRRRISAGLIGRDRDGFVVWSDDVYGDRDADGFPELPVSRIPDARLGSFFLSMLTNGSAGPAGKFGVRNRERPFAEVIYATIPGDGPIQVSAPQAPEAGQRQLAGRQKVYFMLHGDYRDSTTFWGEDDTGATPAFDVGSIPASGIGVAFSGCCWGALTVSEPAFLSSDRPTPKMLERSIALSVLKAGACAFVGVTGVHYSPSQEGDFFGGPLHAAFWREIDAGNRPSQALFNARRTYLSQIPHNRTALWNLAVERKLYKEFTCLGLGW